MVRPPRSKLERGTAYWQRPLGSHGFRQRRRRAPSVERGDHLGRPAQQQRQPRGLGIPAQGEATGMGRQIQGGAGHGHPARAEQHQPRHALPTLRRPQHTLPRPWRLHQLPPGVVARLRRGHHPLHSRRCGIPPRVHRIARRQRHCRAPHCHPQRRHHMHGHPHLATRRRGHTQ